MRICTFNFSVSFVFLTTAKSTYAKPGPYRLLRPRLPKLFVGIVKVPAKELPEGAIQRPSAFPVTTIDPTTSGVTVLPTPVIADEGTTMVKGLPLCRLTIDANSHPLLKRLPLNVKS